MLIILLSWWESHTSYIMYCNHHTLSPPWVCQTYVPVMCNIICYFSFFWLWFLIFNFLKFLQFKFFFFSFIIWCPNYYKTQLSRFYYPWLLGSQMTHLALKFQILWHVFNSCQKHNFWKGKIILQPR